MYGLILVVISYFVFKYLEKKKFKVDIKTFYAVLPYAIIAAVVRVLVDAEVYPKTVLTVSPGIWLLVTIFTILVFYFSFKHYPKTYYKIAMMIGFIVLIPQLFLLRLVNLEALTMIFVTTIFSFIPFVFLYYKRYIDRLILFPLLAHMFDASATFISIDLFGYGEQHFLPDFLIKITGTALVMFPLKLAILVPVIYIVHKHSENKNLRNFLLLVIFLLGLVPALRDILRISMGV